MQVLFKSLDAIKTLNDAIPDTKKNIQRRWNRVC